MSSEPKSSDCASDDILDGASDGLSDDDIVVLLVVEDDDNNRFSVLPVCY